MKIDFFLMEKKSMKNMKNKKFENLNFALKIFVFLNEFNEINIKFDSIYNFVMKIQCKNI